MSQLNIYVPEEIEKKIRKAAKNEGKSLSSFLTDLIRSKFTTNTWPKNFFSSVVGGWQGELTEITRPLPQEREEL